MQNCGAFSLENDTYTVTQNEDITKTQYILTINAVIIDEKNLNPFSEIDVFIKNKWEKVTCSENEYRIILDFNCPTEKIKFIFNDNLADDYILTIKYKAADKEKYYAKIAEEKEEALKAAAQIKVSAGSNLVNIYFQPCCNEYDHTEIQLYIPKEYVTVGGPYGPIEKPSTWSMIKKCKILPEEFYLSIGGLAYGEYAFILKQYDSNNNIIFETDYTTFRIHKPSTPSYGTVNVI